MLRCRSPIFLAAILLVSCRGSNASTGDATPTPPRPSEGIYVLCWYPPLQLAYDPSRWAAELPADAEASLYCPQHNLQSEIVPSCVLFEQGPSDLNTEVRPLALQLGEGHFALTVLPGLEPGVTHAWYVAQGMIPGFSYDLGAPLLRVASADSEWARCKEEAEAALATLHTAQPQELPPP